MTYHLGQHGPKGVVPACGAPADEPVLTADELQALAKRGGRICDRCAAIATRTAADQNV